MSRTVFNPCAEYLALGPYAVRVIPELLTPDRGRGKEIPTRIYYPAEGGPFPAILFSHGAGDSHATAPHLLRHWASHGFVVMAPLHYFGDQRPIIERSVMRLGEEILRPREMGPAAWNARVGDLRTLIDLIGAMPRWAPELDRKLDPDRIGAAGHSYGAYTVMLIGGAMLHDPKDDSVHRFRDPRAKAVLMLSGPGCDGSVLTNRSWREMAVPLMVFAGSMDPGVSITKGTMWRAEPYLFAPAGDKYLVYIHGAKHLSYIGPIFDRTMRDPASRGPLERWFRRVARSASRIIPGVDRTGPFDYTRIASTAFWKAYLCGDDLAKSFLTCRALDEYSGDRAKTEWK